MELIKVKKRPNYYLQVAWNLLYILFFIILIYMFQLHKNTFFSNILMVLYITAISINFIYFGKVNVYYINKIDIDGENITIGYYKYNNYNEITSLIKNCEIERKLVFSRPPHKYFLYVVINNKIIKQYPSFYFDWSIWKDYVIDEVYDKLIEFKNNTKC